MRYTNYDLIDYLARLHKIEGGASLNVNANFGTDSLNPDVLDQSDQFGILKYAFKHALPEDATRFILRNEDSGKVLHFSTIENKLYQKDHQQNEPNQKVTFDKYEDTYALRMLGDVYLDILTGDELVVSEQANSMWELEPTDKGLFFIKADNKLLTASQNSNDITLSESVVGFGQKWRLIQDITYRSSM